MRTLKNELALFKVMGAFFFEGLTSLNMGDAIDQIGLSTPVETAAWKRFLDFQGEGIDKGDPDLFEFKYLPSCEHEAVERAFQTFSKSPDRETYLRMLKELSIPSAQPSQPSTPNNLYVPGISDPLSAPGRLPLPSTEGTGSGSRRSARTRRSNTYYKDASQALEGQSPSRSFVAASEGEDQDDEDHDGTDPEFRPRSQAQDVEEEDSSDDNNARDPKGKRKASSPSRKQSLPSKKLKASSAEELVFAQARGRSRTVVPGPSSSTAKVSSISATTEDKVDVIVFKDDEDEAGDGTGPLETVAVRQAAKDRWAPLKSGMKEWRHEYVNIVHSTVVLYYFDLISRAKKNGTWQLTWRCRCCNKTRTTPTKGFSNLSSHIRAKSPIPHCSRRTNPANHEVRPWTPEEDNLVDIDPSRPATAVPVAEAYRRPNMQGFEAGTYHVKQENVPTTEIKPFREERSDLSEYGSMIPLSECGRLYGIPEETIAVLTAKGFRTPHAVVDMDEEDAKELKLERGERRVIRTAMKLWRMASGTAEGSGASSSTQAREPLAHEVQIPSAVPNKMC